MQGLRALLILFCLLAIALAPAASPVASDNPLDFSVFLPLITTAGAPSANAVVNGSFEDGPVGWTEVQSPILGYPLIVHESELPSGIGPSDGAWVAWLGGDSQLISYIEQVVSIPETNPELTYRHWIDSIWACGNGYGGVTVDDVWVDTYWLCDVNDTGGWVDRTVDLTAYAGQTATLRFVSQTTDDYSSLYIDAVSIHPLP
jgi:hypothetical protein